MLYDEQITLQDNKTGLINKRLKKPQLTNVFPVKRLSIKEIIY